MRTAAVRAIGATKRLNRFFCNLNCTEDKKILFAWQWNNRDSSHCKNEYSLGTYAPDSAASDSSSAKASAKKSAGVLSVSAA